MILDLHCNGEDLFQNITLSDIIQDFKRPIDYYF